MVFARASSRMWDMPPASYPPPAAPRIWPMTALVVTLAVSLMLVDGFNAMIQVAAFFGETAVRDDYIGSGMTCLTALPAFAAMIWFGWQYGSRSGLILIGVPASLMAYVGLQLLGTDSGSSRDPDPGRTADLTDLFGDLTWLNWCAVAVFSLGAMATHLQRRHSRHTLKGSAA
jgi:hypothetical protein